MTASTVTVAPALHPVPERGAVVKEQIGAVSIAIRKEQLFFVGTLAAFVLLGIYSALRGNVHGQGKLEYGPAATIPMTLVALLIPFGVWRASDRERRAYDWSMPVAQSTHTIIRMLAGWLWLMLGVAVYLVVLIGIEVVMVHIAGGWLTNSIPAWQWLVPFTAVSLAYLLTSIPIIGSEHPWRWIGGILIGYPIALLVLDMLELHGLNQALQNLFAGYYGLGTAIFGDVSGKGHEIPGGDPSHWLVATALWGVPVIVGVWLAARRHSTS